MQNKVLFGSLLGALGAMALWQMGANAATWAGPNANCYDPTKPECNTDGVIWNRDPDGSVIQPGNYNISGKARIGNWLNVGGDIFLNDSKALRIDTTGTSKLNIGNWGSNPQKGLNVGIYGTLQVIKPLGSVTPATVSTTQLCLGTDCRSAWPTVGGGGTVTSIGSGNGLTGGPITGTGSLSIITCGTNKILKVDGTGNWACADDATGAGTITGILGGTGISVANGTGPQPSISLNNGDSLGCSANQVRAWNGTAWICQTQFDQTGADARYVKKTGDNMTGQLAINTTQQYGIYANTTNWGNYFQGPIAVYGLGTSFGGYFNGDTYGINSISNNPGSTGVLGQSNGVSAIGVRGVANNGIAGQFQSSAGQALDVSGPSVMINPSTSIGTSGLYVKGYDGMIAEATNGTAVTGRGISSGGTFFFNGTGANGYGPVASLGMPTKAGSFKRNNNPGTGFTGFPEYDVNLAMQGAGVSSVAYDIVGSSGVAGVFQRLNATNGLKYSTELGTDLYALNVNGPSRFSGGSLIVNPGNSLCLGGVCNSAWPAMTGFVSLTAADTKTNQFTIQAAAPSYLLAVNQLNAGVTAIQANSIAGNGGTAVEAKGVPAVKGTASNSGAGTDKYGGIFQYEDLTLTPKNSKRAYLGNINQAGEFRNINLTTNGDINNVKLATNNAAVEVATGNVGIGISNPNRKLYVAEYNPGLAFPVKIDNPYGNGTITTGSGAGILFSVQGDGWNMDPNRGKGALVYTQTDYWGRGKFAFLQEPNATVSNPDMTDSVMVITNDGRVGIHTDNPTNTLDVAGMAKINYVDSYGLQTSGYVRISDYWNISQYTDGGGNKSLSFDTPGGSRKLFISPDGSIYTSSNITMWGLNNYGTLYSPNAATLGTVTASGVMTVNSDLVVGSYNNWGDGSASAITRTGPDGKSWSPWGAGSYGVNGKCYYTTSLPSATWILCPKGTYSAGMQVNMAAQTYNLMCCEL